jgi:hypothetical protein
VAGVEVDRSSSGRPAAPTAAAKVRLARSLGAAGGGSGSAASGTRCHGGGRVAGGRSSSALSGTDDAGRPARPGALAREAAGSWAGFSTCSPLAVACSTPCVGACSSGAGSVCFLADAASMPSCSSAPLSAVAGAGVDMDDCELDGRLDDGRGGDDGWRAPLLSLIVSSALPLAAVSPEAASPGEDAAPVPVGSAPSDSALAARFGLCGSVGLVTSYLGPPRCHSVRRPHHSVVRADTN